MKSNLKKVIFAALFAALTCAATLVIRIPTPGTTGYIHPGDAIVILSGILLGPVYGSLAAGIGSALSDLIGGYMIYVPATFLIKGLSALLIGFVFQRFFAGAKERHFGIIFCGIIHILLIPSLYFSYESILYTFKGALASLVPNIIQAAGGALIAAVLYPMLMAVPDIRRMVRRV